jgi:hypothetical protein
MEPEGSLPSQEPATCPYPEPKWIKSISPNPISLRSILMLSTHLRLGLPSGLLPPGLPTKMFYAPLTSPMRATCPTHKYFSTVSLIRLKLYKASIFIKLLKYI